MIDSITVPWLVGVNYLRRAPRSNELFFVYDETTVRPVIESFAALRRATR